MAWEVKKLGDVCEVKPPKKEARDKLKENDPVSFVPMEDLGINQKVLIPIKERKLKEVEGSYTYFANGDVLLAKITPCFENGKLGIAKSLKNGVGFGSSEYIVFRTNRNLFSEYLYYFLLRPQFREEGAKRMTGAVGHKRVSKEFIENIEIPLPPLPIQKRIVAILDKAFESITKAKENAEKNLNNANEVFDSYLESVFENKGEGWEEKTLGEIAEINPKKSEIKNMPIDKVVSFLPMEDLGILQKQTIPVKTRKLSEVVGSYTYFAENDILLAKVTPCFENGKLGIARNLKNGIGFGSSEYIVFRSQSNLCFEYLFYLLSSNKFRNNGKKLMFGACGLKRLSKDYVQNTSIFLPPLNEQQSIIKKLDNLSQKTKHLELIYQKKLSSLEELQKSILQKAFNGELTP